MEKALLHTDGSEMTFVAGGTLVKGGTNLKNLKTQLWLDDLLQVTIGRHELYSDGRFEPLTNSGKSLTWGYKLKTLKSAW